MNKMSLKFALMILSSLGAILSVGDGIEDLIVGDVGDKGKIFDGYTPLKDPDPVVDPEEPEEPEIPEEPEEPKDDLGKINKTFGTEFKTVDELLASDIPSRYKEHPEVSKRVTEKDTELQDLRTQLEEMQGQLDPMAYFANQQEYIRQQLLKKHPEYDPSALAKIVNSDIEKADAISVLKMQLLLKNGDVFESESSAMEYLQDQYGFDPDTPFNELESKIKTKILLDAKQARQEFKTLQQEIQLPSKEAGKAEREQRISFCVGING
jgi:hypothetical protein